MICYNYTCQKMNIPTNNKVILLHKRNMIAQWIKYYRGSPNNEVGWHSIFRTLKSKLCRTALNIAQNNLLCKAYKFKLPAHTQFISHECSIVNSPHTSEEAKKCLKNLNSVKFPRSKCREYHLSCRQQEGFNTKTSFLE